MQKQAARARTIRRNDTAYVGGLSAKAFREHLRKYNQQPKSHIERAIGAMRLKVHWSRYGEIIRSLQTSAPSQLAALFPMGQRRYGDLLWGEPFPEIPLSDELVWTAHWLKVRHKQLSSFRKASLRIQELVGAAVSPEAAR